MAKIFNNPTALEESLENVVLSKKQQSEAKRLEIKLSNCIENNESKIIAYVGRFGSGKSATLRHVEQIYKTSKVRPEPIWLNFEAWRYADRTKLWDGFVLEVAEKTGGDKSRSEVSNKIDGLAGVARTIYNHPVKVALLVFFIWLIFSAAVWTLLFNQDATLALFIKDLLKYATPVLLGAFALAGVTTLFRQNAAPLTRVEELEDILDETLCNLEQPLIIIAEDVDRAGDEGVIFLETLRSFINKHREDPYKHPLIVIAPQDITYISALNEDKIKGLERSVKIYDGAVYYSSSIIQVGDTSALLAAAGVKNEYKQCLRQVAGDILRLHKEQLSLRMLKFIFREVQEFADTQEKIDPGIAFLFISMRYIKHIENGKSANTYLEIFNQTNLQNLNFGMSSQPIIPFIKILAKQAEMTAPISKCNLGFTPDNHHEITAQETQRHLNGNVSIELKIHERYQALLS